MELNPSVYSQKMAEIELNMRSFLPESFISDFKQSVMHYERNSLNCIQTDKPESVTPHDTLIGVINEERTREKQKDIWMNSPYKELPSLQSNNVGRAGEKFIQSICKNANIPANCDGSKTKQIGGGKGDGTIMGATIEVKTAHQGSSSSSFQHEFGEVPWKGSDYIIFIDISPDCIYLTIF